MVCLVPIFLAYRRLIFPLRIINDAVRIEAARRSKGWTARGGDSLRAISLAGEENDRYDVYKLR